VAVEDQFAVVGIDPTTGSQKFLVPFIGVNQEIIIAGDGYAYVPYVYTPISMPDPPDPCTGQIGLLRIGIDGTYDDLWIANMTQDYSELCGFETPNIITNADKGVLLTWSYGPGNALVFGAAMVTGTSVSPIIPAPQIPGQEEEVVPVLQAQDGSFIGTTWIPGGEFLQMCMVAFDEHGTVRWIVPGYGPKIATADGGVIAQAYKSGESGGFFGPAVTFDQNGNATGQMASLATYSWTGYSYQVGSVDQFVGSWYFLAATFLALDGGQYSSGTASFPIDSIANQNARSILTPDRWKNFEHSNCSAVIASDISLRYGINGKPDDRVIEQVKKRQSELRFYDVGDPGVGDLKLANVQTKFTNPVKLKDFVRSSNALTPILNGEGPVVLRAGFFAKPYRQDLPYPQFTLVHEVLFHAWAGLTDNDLLLNTTLAQHGLWNDGVGTTTISTWMSTDCTCTPGNPANPPNSCQLNSTNKW
jgi:hypothetical protein